MFLDTELLQAFTKASLIPFGKDEIPGNEEALNHPTVAAVYPIYLDAPLTPAGRLSSSGSSPASKSFIRSQVR